jgi:outer membrane protein TolC
MTNLVPTKKRNKKTDHPLMKRFLILLMAYSLSVIPVKSDAQGRDSMLELSQEEFLNIVRTFHPVARQANLLVDRAKAELISSKAGFDPTFFMSAERKTFNGKNYFNWIHPELRIPTWYGVEINAGVENNLGDLLNSEETPGKSSYLGISVPLAKNLVMDKRRAVLMQARVFREQSKAERLIMLNDLLFDASFSYWNWAKEYMVYRVLEETITQNQIRYGLVKLSYRQGDKPAIDTTEALAQLQSIQLARNDAWLRFRNAGLELSNYMWQANDTPFYMPPVVIPDTTWNVVKIANQPLPVLDTLLIVAARSHPKLQSYDYKLEMLDIDRKLKFQELLPIFNVKYNFLNSGFDVTEGASWRFYQNNYKFGFDFGLPLRLSRGRGDYKAAKIKINETNLDLSQTRLAIENKVKYYFNELAMLQTQVVIAEENYLNYKRLFKGEEMRFKIGEGSLFLLNLRELKLLESKQKLLELKSKFYSSYQGLQWSTGQLR